MLLSPKRLQTIRKTKLQSRKRYKKAKRGKGRKRRKRGRSFRRKRRALNLRIKTLKNYKSQRGGVIPADKKSILFFLPALNKNNPQISRLLLVKVEKDFFIKHFNPTLVQPPPSGIAFASRPNAGVILNIYKSILKTGKLPEQYNKVMEKIQPFHLKYGLNMQSNSNFISDLNSKLLNTQENLPEGTSQQELINIIIKIWGSVCVGNSCELTDPMPKPGPTKPPTTAKSPASPPSKKPDTPKPTLPAAKELAVAKLKRRRTDDDETPVGGIPGQRPTIQGKTPFPPAGAPASVPQQSPHKRKKKKPREVCFANEDCKDPTLPICNETTQTCGPQAAAPVPLDSPVAVTEPLTPAAKIPVSPPRLTPPPRSPQACDQKDPNACKSGFECKTNRCRPKKTKKKSKKAADINPFAPPGQPAVTIKPPPPGPRTCGKNPFDLCEDPQVCVQGACVDPQSPPALRDAAAKAAAARAAMPGPKRPDMKKAKKKPKRKGIKRGNECGPRSDPPNRECPAPKQCVDGICQGGTSSDPASIVGPSTTPPAPPGAVDAPPPPPPPLPKVKPPPSGPPMPCNVSDPMACMEEGKVCVNEVCVEPEPSPASRSCDPTDMIHLNCLETETCDENGRCVPSVDPPPGKKKPDTRLAPPPRSPQACDPKVPNACKSGFECKNNRCRPKKQKKKPDVGKKKCDPASKNPYNCEEGEECTKDGECVKKGTIAVIPPPGKKLPGVGKKPPVTPPPSGDCCGFPDRAGQCPICPICNYNLSDVWPKSGTKTFDGVCPYCSYPNLNNPEGGPSWQNFADTTNVNRACYKDWPRAADAAKTRGRPLKCAAKEPGPAKVTKCSVQPGPKQPPEQPGPEQPKQPSKQPSKQPAKQPAKQPPEQPGPEQPEQPGPEQPEQPGPEQPGPEQPKQPSKPTAASAVPALAVPALAVPAVPALAVPAVPALAVPAVASPAASPAASTAASPAASTAA